MSAELIILIGSGRVGKTTYAHKIEKEKGHEYISIDNTYNWDKGRTGYFEFLDTLSNKLNSNSDKNYILDGYVGHDGQFKYLKEILKHHKIKPIIVFAGLKEFKERYTEKFSKEIKFRNNPEGVKKRVDDILKVMGNLYRSIHDWWCIDTGIYGYINSSGDVLKESNYAEMVKTFLTKEKVEEFLKELETKKYDKYYQTIDLPFGLKIQGYNADYEHKTWEKIKDIYDFKDKKIADIGGFHGFFSFNMCEKGGNAIVLDSYVGAVETGIKIARLKGLEVKFKVFDVEKDEIPEKYDLILFTNISHHMKDVKKTFDNLFKHTNAIITEIQFSNITREELIKIAKDNGFYLEKKVDGVRPYSKAARGGNENILRSILLFSRGKNDR